jgi:hypothetical protein
MKGVSGRRYIQSVGNAIPREAVFNPRLLPRVHPMEIRCPNCGSTDFKKASLVYEEGLSRIKADSRLRGVSFGDEGPNVFVGTAETNGIYQTDLSKKLRPPKKWSYLKPIGWCAGISLVLLIVYVHSVMGSTGKVSSLPGMVATVAISGLFLVLMFATWKHNRLAYPRRLAEWQRSFVCLRCGMVSQQQLL